MFPQQLIIGRRTESADTCSSPIALPDCQTRDPAVDYQTYPQFPQSQSSFPSLLLYQRSYISLGA
jgi:hypothetical protein